MVILGVIVTFTISGIGGPTIIREALDPLYKEGKIGEALYRELLDYLRQIWKIEIPIEEIVKIPTTYHTIILKPDILNQN